MSTRVLAHRYSRIVGQEFHAHLVGGRKSDKSLFCACSAVPHAMGVDTITRLDSDVDGTVQLVIEDVMFHSEHGRGLFISVMRAQRLRAQHVHVEKVGEDVKIVRQLAGAFGRT